ncbi:amino-acid N-acetyltransferase [Thioalkalivibrio sp. HK1]|uniref:amino-acid N-acetyltransferase n=1 Tax=Thioalkalivibrio sp. HK1 TaxID=1469245 RepID=UPI00046FFC89|nr:amino-acid N-acetyltransferase [Thioalkalivibrio sp. HK1]
MNPPPSPADASAFLYWIRQAAPYISSHRGKIFVVAIPGAMVDHDRFREIARDLAILHSLGIDLVVVHGLRRQIDRQLIAKGHRPRYLHGVRITDDHALAATREAAGSIRMAIESKLSSGIANTPIPAGMRVRVSSGNFITARPLGIHEGVDFKNSGEVRRIDVEAIRQQLAGGAIVLVSPLGYSPTGHVFCLESRQVATSVAIETNAAKLVFLNDDPLLEDAQGRVLREITLDEAKELARIRSQRTSQSPECSGIASRLQHAIEACRRGVQRVHLVNPRIDGALLLELLTRDGIGTMINADNYDSIRQATIDDVGGILDLIRPLEDSGVLVKRAREKIETEIPRFNIIERDGTVIGCAAIYPYPEEALAELACLAVHDAYRRNRNGERLLALVEKKAKRAGATRIFVLTTRTGQWFEERGFVESDRSSLPREKQSLYNDQRGSRVLIKDL